jgi:hypothetical protein
MAAKAVSQLREFPSEFGKVIDLAIENNHESAASGDHGLVTFRREVEDGKPSMAES